jgi:hypothetical protein
VEKSDRPCSETPREKLVEFYQVRLQRQKVPLLKPQQQPLIQRNGSAFKIATVNNGECIRVTSLKCRAPILAFHLWHQTKKELEINCPSHRTSNPA